MFRAFKWISAIVIVCGIIFSAVNISRFNDGNLGLMIGFGFLVGGILIWMFGMVAGLMQKNEETQAEPAKEGN